MLGLRFQHQPFVWWSDERDWSSWHLPCENMRIWNLRYVEKNLPKNREKREWRKSCDSSMFDTERRRSGHSGWSLQCNRNFNSKFNRMLYLQHRPLQFRNGSIGYTISFHGHVDYYRLLLRTIEIHRPLMKNFNLYTFSTLKNNHISAPLLNDFKLLPS